MVIRKEEMEGGMEGMWELGREEGGARRGMHEGERERASKQTNKLGSAK